MAGSEQLKLERLEKKALSNFVATALNPLNLTLAFKY